VLKELLIYLHMIWARDKELHLKYSLLKHQSKMLDIHEKYKEFDFKNGAARYEFEYLHTEIMNRFYRRKEEDQ
jgi:hypothetical protein